MSIDPSQRDPVILFVDDEEGSCKVFERAIGKIHPVVTAGSVAEARVKMTEIGDDLGVVVSDQRMPVETGVQLLKEVRRDRPSVVRVLTTAYADLDSAVDAVNSGFAFQYVHKPWDDVKELRAIMRRAVDYHQVQFERDLLLREKLSTLQRMIVVDRVRSFAVLAAGLAHRLRNPLSALKTFLEVAPAEPVGGPRSEAGSGQVMWDDLWDLARDESERVLELIQQVIDLTAEPEYRFDQAQTAGELLSSVEWSVEPAFDLADDLQPLRVDAAMVRRLLAVLADRLARLRASEPVRIRVEPLVEVWGSPGLRFSLRVDGEALDQRELGILFAALSPGDHDPGQREGDSDLLAAYFCAFHHGGNLTICRESAGFDLDLPLDPESGEQPPLEANWIERIFTLFEP